MTKNMKKKKMRKRAIAMLIEEMHSACRLIPSALETTRDAKQRVRVRTNTSERLSGIIDALREVKLITRASADRCETLKAWYMWRCPEALADLRVVYPETWGK